MPSPKIFNSKYNPLTNENKMFIACIWCAVSPNISSIRASRVFQGFGLSALQRYSSFFWSLSVWWRDNLIVFSLLLSSNYFCRSIRSVFSYWILLAFSVHERGNRSAIWSFSIVSGFTLSVMSALAIWNLFLTAGITGDFNQRLCVAEFVMANGVLVYCHTFRDLPRPCILFCSGGAPINFIL